MTLTDAHRWQRHEILLSALGGLTTLALAFHAGPTAAATLSTAVATAIFCLVVVATKNHTTELIQKARFIAAFCYVLWFYSAVKIIVPALGNFPHDETLIFIDEKLFGVTPSVPAQNWSTVGLNELMSGCYLTYLVYLHVCVIHSWFMPLAFTKQFANWIYSVYAVGLAGYLLYPAIGPESAFRELFGPDLRGPMLTPLNRWIVNSGSSVYDAFPSLHVLITFAMIDFDRRHLRRRFNWMVLPAIGIVVSTIYLRYHYAIDLIAGGLLFAAAKWCFKDGEIGVVETGYSDE
ncbi:MAG: phosphatase PAP2 family protein [Rubripirellula sp.]|nr:phosphatase PAP2 family protein [Rubripirellula sp.]